MGHYASRGEVATLTADLIAAMLGEIAADTPTLNRIVADGPSEWRNKFHRTLKGLPVNDDIADSCFAFLCKQQILHYGGQHPHQVLDTYEPPPAPPTDEQIKSSWEIESASSYEGRKQFYGDKSPEQFLAEMLDREPS